MINLKRIVLFIFCVNANLSVLSQNIIFLNPGIDQISSTMSIAGNGDILELSGGVYLETKTLNTIEGDLTIRGSDNAEVIVYGPTEVEGDLIHVFGNLWLENLVFIGSEISRNGITNYYGGVDSDGAELITDKNSIYISNCMFLVITENHIWQPYSLSEYSDGKWHPIDTLRVTDCLFYGGDITRGRAIKIFQRQGRYIEVRRSTIWSIGQDGLEVKGGYVGDDYDNPGPGSDLQYVTTVADHLTIFNTYNDNPEQSIGGGGEGIHYEWSNRKQSMTNTIVFRSGRFCFKGKRGESTLTVASYCMGDSANLSGGYSPPTVYYWMMTKGPGCREDNPHFNDHWNGDFSLNPLLSDAIGSADDGSNMGDPHWDKPATHWPKKVELEAIIAKAKPEGSGLEKSYLYETRNFKLFQNYPNPFNPETEISFFIERTGNVILEIYTVYGCKLRTLIDNVMHAGSYSVVWKGHDELGYNVPTGIYFCRLIFDSDIMTRKMLLIK
jgi:hypothetical protein